MASSGTRDARGSRWIWAPALAAVFATAVLAGCVDAQPKGAVREMTFWVEAMDWEIHPGVTTPVWAFCGQGDGVEPVGQGPCGVPGPTVRVQEGDTVRLLFRNTHSIAHTIHFHGWHAFMADMNGQGLLHGDLVVPAQEERLIEWVAQPAGTFIYHCHFDTPTHMEMGMSGAFIVEPRRGPSVDRQFVAVLDEWQVRAEPELLGNMPAYNYFTISGKSFPLTQPWIVDPGDRVRVHLVNAGYEFHAMHLHGYTPMSWEGVAGRAAGRLTDVREIAPGQSVVFEFTADREGVWLFHDHVVPRVTAASDGAGFGAYPRGMLTVLVVGQAYADALAALAPSLVEAAMGDQQAPDGAHEHAHGALGGSPMKDYAFVPEIRIKAGQNVTWTNRDPVYHTVTLDDGSVDSGRIEAGKSWSHRFDTPGTYTYHCEPHAYKDATGAWKGMVGRLVVE